MLPKYPEKATEYLNEHFPEGNKKRGDAMVLVALAFMEGRECSEAENDYGSN